MNLSRNKTGAVHARRLQPKQMKLFYPLGKVNSQSSFAGSRILDSTVSVSPVSSEDEFVSLFVSINMKHNINTPHLRDVSFLREEETNSPEVIRAVVQRATPRGYVMFHIYTSANKRNTDDFSY